LGTSAKILNLSTVIKFNPSPDRVFKDALRKLKGAILIGYNNEGREYFASTYADSASN
jgi:hypothetical protein